ncbi:MAG: hypothetical protein NXI32_02465 [bacterium]|nr:hypothetical protein [bacterium]
MSAPKAMSAEGSRAISRNMLLGLAVSLIGSTPQAGFGQYSPDHPRVQQSVERGLKFLESSGEPASRGSEYEDGGPILVGYTVLKVTGDTDHPLVRDAINRADRLATNVNRSRPAGESKVVYESAMAAVLLATVDAGRYRPQLEQILQFFVNNQKPHGGFGYLGRDTGDTSQVQYVMLALWTLHQVGLDIPPAMVEDALSYLKATMDPSGAWGYQGKLGNGRLVAQERVSTSLATAGAGSMLIGGDILGFYGVRKLQNDSADDVPEAFVRIDLKAQTRRRSSGITMSKADIENPINAAVRYLNTSDFAGAYWYYYWRYSQERYESFLEIMNNRQEKSPGWYNRGVEELFRLQDDDGGWGRKKTDVTPRSICTAFSILFLIRSTQTAIGKLDEGMVFGSYQLPNDVTTVRMMGDRLVSDEETSVQNLLSMLEDDAASDVEIGLLPENLKLAEDAEQRKEQTARLARLLDSQDYKARQVAAKLLGRSDDLDVVPDLIYALSDPNELVPMLAEESLRLLSRKLNAGQLTRNPSPAERAAAEKFWREWYLGIRPEYIFLER